MYKWGEETPQAHIMRGEAEINNNTMVDWAQYCRDACMEWEVRRPTHTQMGGTAGDGGIVLMEVRHEGHPRHEGNYRHEGHF